MNKKYLLVGLFAANLSTTSIAAADASDAYAGVNVGEASLDSSGFDSTISWKFFVGYAFNDILTVEGGYVSFGEMDGPTELGATTSLKSTGFEVTAIGNFPINSQFSLFGKVGLLTWGAESNNPNITGSLNSGTDVFFGVGGRYEISDNLAVRASWESYSMDEADIDLLSVSAVFGL